MAPTHNQNLTTPVFAAVDTGLFQETGGLVRKLGEEGEFDHGRIFGLWSPHGLIERPNELCIYYGGCNLGKNTNTQIQRPVPGHQRRRLGGHVRIGFEDLMGACIRRLSVEDCDPLEADAISHVVSWNHNSDLNTLDGRHVRLDLDIQDARFYAFNFA